MRIMAFDPGVGGTGWAVFDGPRFVGAGTIRGFRGSCWEAKHDLIAKTAATLIQQLSPESVHVEMPFFAQSKQVVAKSGALVKLTILAARIYQLAGTGASATVWVPVINWKGQMSKKMSDARTARKLPQVDLTTYSEHARDAIGIGLYVVGGK